MKNILLWGLFIFIFYFFYFFIDFPLILTWFCLCDCHFENLIANHTWIIIISFKPCFIFIKIEINQTLVSHTHTNIYIYIYGKRLTKINLWCLQFEEPFNTTIINNNNLKLIHASKEVNVYRERLTKINFNIILLKSWIGDVKEMKWKASGMPI